MFKIGQIVWCKRDGIYDITNYHVKCEVTEAHKMNCAIRVKVLEGRYSGYTYPVDGNCFELVQNKAVVL